MKHLLLIIFGTLLSSGIYAQTLSIADTSFEASGPNNSPWTSSSSNFGSSFCDEVSCGNCGGPCVPNTGTWYVWFGGTSSAETGTAAQSFTTSTSGTGILTYHLKVPMKGAIGDTLSIELDGIAVDKYNTIDSIGAYQLITLNVGTINAGAHDLNFVFEKQASASSVNVLLDDVQLTINSGAGYEELDFSNGIKIQNNITDDIVKIAYNFNEVQQLEMTATDMNGKLISSNKFENEITGEKSISTADWNPGVYHISIRSNKGFLKSSKIIVQ